MKQRWHCAAAILTAICLIAADDGDKTTDKKVRAPVDLIKDNPPTTISVGQSDNYFYCHYIPCQKVNDREAGSMGTMLQVVNEVADAIAKENANVFNSTYAYQITRCPVKHLRPRVVVVGQLATIEACQMDPIADKHCPRNAEIYADMKAWKHLAKQLDLRNYNTVFPDYMLPVPKLAGIKKADSRGTVEKK